MNRINGAPLLSTLVSLALGVAIAAIVACGGASTMKSSAPTVPPASTDANTAGAEPGVEGLQGKHDPRIEKLADEIAVDMKKMNLPPPVAPAGTCVDPSCLQPLAVRPQADPACSPGTSDTCTDTCKLADSICENAEKICDIAKELGNDAWANGKCADGNTSCKAAHDRCCGCQ